MGKDYKSLEVWKESRKLVSSVYMVTEHFPDSEKFGLTNQIRRASVSIPSNIAEGIARNSNKETRQFFYISKGSLFEVETQLYLAFDLKYINETSLNEILENLIQVRKLILGFIKYLNSNT